MAKYQNVGRHENELDKSKKYIIECSFSGIISYFCVPEKE
jgi:hypothetical protein